MSTLAHPSPDAPGAPSVSLEVDDGCEPVHAPGTMPAAPRPRAEGFSTNVVVIPENCAPDHAVVRSLEQVPSIVASRRGGASGRYAAELGGAHLVGCDATWPDPEVETVRNTDLLHVAGARGTAYLVQLAGAVGGANAEADDEITRRVLTTWRAQPWPALAPTTQGLRA